MIWAVFEWHVMPDHEHQTGSCKLEFEKVEEGSQSWSVLRGSLREDLSESREMSWRGGVEVEKTRYIWQKKDNVRKRREDFMALGMW